MSALEFKPLDTRCTSVFLSDCLVPDVASAKSLYSIIYRAETGRWTAVNNDDETVIVDDADSYELALTECQADFDRYYVAAA